MEGLRWLMPLGETLGSTLPRKDSRHPMFAHKFGLWFRAGAFATLPNLPSVFCVPQVQVLIPLAPLVDHTNTGATNLVNSVGVGVGIVVLLVLRFYKGIIKTFYLCWGNSFVCVYDLFSIFRRTLATCAWHGIVELLRPVLLQYRLFWLLGLVFVELFQLRIEQHGFWGCNTCFLFLFSRFYATRPFF